MHSNFYLSAVTLWFFLIISESFSHAGTRPPLTTDRPSQSDASTLVPEGFFQVEAGYTFLQDDSAGTETRNHSLPNLNLRYGLLEQLEVRLGWDGYIASNADPGPVLKGIGDGQISAKLYLKKQTDRIPEITLLAGTTLPTGANSVSSQRMDPFFRFLMTYALPRGFSLGSNLGVTWKTQSAIGGKDTNANFIYTALMGYAMNPELDSFVEFFGSIPMDSGRDQHGFDLGLAWRVLPEVQIDLSGGVGLNDAAVDAFVSSGVTFRLP